MPEQTTALDTWAIVELFGHKKLAGKLTEQTFGTATMFRLDVPETDQGGVFTKPYTKLIGVSSIYCITPVTEPVGRATVLGSRLFRGRLDEPRKKSYLTVTDQFCGAGGSSIGAAAAGLEIRMAMNHWDLAVETHNTNFPTPITTAPISRRRILAAIRRRTS
jgi:hypothetical protein